MDNGKFDTFCLKFVKICNENLLWNGSMDIDRILRRVLVMFRIFRDPNVTFHNLVKIEDL